MWTKYLVVGRNDSTLISNLSQYIRHLNMSFAFVNRIYQWVSLSYNNIWCCNNCVKIFSNSFGKRNIRLSESSDCIDCYFNKQNCTRSWTEKIKFKDVQLRFLQFRNISCINRDNFINTLYMLIKRFNESNNKHKIYNSFPLIEQASVF